MSFVDNIKKMINVPEDEYYPEDEQDDLDAPYEEEAVEESPRIFRSKSNSNSNVVNINTTAKLQVVLVKPERFEDASGIADHLNEKRTVVLNLEAANRDVARRLVDFISGVAYANKGQIKRVANSTFIITPYNVDVMGDLLDDLENNGVFF
ncbi:MAG: cell division protein SepF [Clostridia bacterium]